MRKLSDAWKEIVRDFGWPVFVVLVLYSALAVIVGSRTSDIYLVPDTIAGLIRVALWLTVIAITVPASAVSIPVRRPWPELLFLIASIVLFNLAAAHLWNLRATDSPYSDLFLYAAITVEWVLAICFAYVFGYSAADLGIPLKHWRLYFGLIVLGLPVSVYFLQGDNFAMLIGALSLVFLCILYFTNPRRWQGLLEDIQSLRPYAIPILLCALVTILIQWARYK